MRSALIALAALIVIVASFFALRLFTNQKESPATESVHHASHIDKAFYGNIAATGTSRLSDIKGAIVSHHLLVGDEIAKTFASIASEKIKTVVIVGPDHFRSGPGKVSVSRYTYETPWGAVEPDLKMIDALIETGTVSQDEYVFEIEHSIASLVPYVKYHFPNAKLVPIVMQRNVSPEVSQKIGIYLAEQLPEDSIVIASVDFSHHLDSTSADFHDAKSLAAIRAFDFESLPRLEIDSPASIATLLHYLDTKEARKAVSFSSTNSARFLGIPDSPDVTSYLFAAFAAGEIGASATDVVSVLVPGDVGAGIPANTASASDIDLFEHFRGVEGNFLKGFDLFITDPRYITPDIERQFNHVNIKHLDVLSHPYLLQFLLPHKEQVTAVFDQIPKKPGTGAAVGLVFVQNNMTSFVFPYTFNAKHQPVMMPYAAAQAYCSSLNIPATPQDNKCIFEDVR